MVFGSLIRLFRGERTSSSARASAGVRRFGAQHLSCGFNGSYVNVFSGRWRSYSWTYIYILYYNMYIYIYIDISFAYLIKYWSVKKFTTYLTNIVSFHQTLKILAFLDGFLHQDRTEDPIDTPPNGPAGPATVTTPVAPVAPNATAPCGGSKWRLRDMAEMAHVNGLIMI